LADRVPILRTGHTVIVRKYYLDDLFLAIIRGIQYPVAKAAYWVNQNVLDGVINGVGRGAQAGAHLVYDVIDQRVVDGVVNAGRLQYTVNHGWIEVINSRYHIGIDGISLPLLLLSMVITVLCVIYSWDHFPEPHNPKAFLILMLVLETGMNGTFAAQDLILFF